MAMVEHTPVTIKEAAALKHCSTDRIRRIIKARGIQPLEDYLGKAKVYPLEEINGKKVSIVESLRLKNPKLQEEIEKLQQTLRTIAAVAEGRTL